MAEIQCIPATAITFGFTAKEMAQLGTADATFGNKDGVATADEYHAFRVKSMRSPDQMSNREGWVERQLRGPRGKCGVSVGSPVPPAPQPSTLSCRFKALGDDISMSILDAAAERPRAEVKVGSDTTSYASVRKQSMTSEKIQQDETAPWALRQVGISPAKVRSLDWYSIDLDDDGGGLHLLRAVQLDGTVKQAGMMSFMGGVRGQVCQ